MTLLRENTPPGPFQKKKENPITNNVEENIFSTYQLLNFYISSFWEKSFPGSETDNFSIKLKKIKTRKKMKSRLLMEKKIKNFWFGSNFFTFFWLKMKFCYLEK